MHDQTTHWTNFRRGSDGAYRMNGDREDSIIRGDMNNSTVFSRNDRCILWIKGCGVWRVRAHNRGMTN